MTADVLKAAQTDKTDTEARIKNLREEIEREEARIEEINGFIKTFKQYEAAAGSSSTPSANPTALGTTPAGATIRQ
jgi:hypothetical protein